jgi:hypothetical protein
LVEPAASRPPRARARKRVVLRMMNKMYVGNTGDDEVDVVDGVQRDCGVGYE